MESNSILKRTMNLKNFLNLLSHQNIILIVLQVLSNRKNFVALNVEHGSYQRLIHHSVLSLSVPSERAKEGAYGRL